MQRSLVRFGFLGSSLLVASVLLSTGCSSSGSADVPNINVGGSGGSSLDGSLDVKTSTGGSAGLAGSGGSGGLKDSGPATDTASESSSTDAPLDGQAGQAGSGGGSSEAGSPCQKDADCQGNAAGPYCNTQTGQCVGCKPSDPSTCVVGQYCDATTLTCLPGCDGPEDCASSSDAGAVNCNSTTHTCVGCTLDDQCPLGQICKSGSCQGGCTVLHGCQSGFACCSGQCVNTSTDPNNCGACAAKCDFPNSTAACLGGKCGLQSCSPGYEDCDKLAATGCETLLGDSGTCLCTPNATESCYSGPPGTEGIGVCKGGTRTCNSSGSGWSLCLGEVLPTPESCYTLGDDNCNGETNESGTGCACTPQAQEPCYTGPAATRNVGACQDGSHVCNSSGTAWGACIGQILPTPETCLTPVDDNCNGEVNEAGGSGCQCTPNSTAPCYSGPPGTENVGLCKAGTQTCDAQGTGFGPCLGSVVPSPDICSDNDDNDCNGVVNDGFLTGASGCVCFPNSNTTCYSGSPSTLNVGVCVAGTGTCNAQGTAYGTCQGEVVPSIDHCTDILDNDCNGILNDGLGKGGNGCLCTPGAQQPCYTGPTGTLGVGVCVAGLQTCSADGTSWGVCIGQIIPDIDSCLNSVDDDCNGVVNDGFGKGGTGCTCLPGAQTSCYEGPAGTVNVGPCKAGLATCNSSGTATTSCLGQVLPIDEICSNGVNDDCVGGVDDPPDKDGDGWGRCGGDCCDEAGPVCGSPAQVNPGAIEVQGDSVDNNCNGQTDESPLSTCSTGTNFDSTVTAAKALALLNAMEICQVSQNGSWGIVPGSYYLARASGSGSPNYREVAIMQQFGTNGTNVPRYGNNMAVLSSGRARDANDTDPTAAVSYSYYGDSAPSDFVAPYGGALPSTKAGCPNGSSVNDGVTLRVQLKVPTNANSFTFQFRFYSQEYWWWTCTAFNDFFVALLNSSWVPGAGQTPIPADHNISFDANGGYISVNTNAFFTTCCQSKTGYTCPDGNAALGGTGYVQTPNGTFGAGGTSWLTTTSPVVPGETITLRFVIWDTSDQLYDSLVLLDNFRWSASPSNGPITTQ